MNDKGVHIFFLTERVLFKSATKNKINKLFFRLIYATKVLPLVRKYGTENIEFIVFDEKLFRYMEFKNFKCKLISPKIDIIDSKVFTAMDIVRNSLNNKSFFESSEYNNFSLWKTIDNVIFDDFARTLRLVDAIDLLVKSKSNYKFNISDTKSFFGRILVEICNKYKISFSSGFSYSRITFFLEQFRFRFPRILFKKHLSFPSVNDNSLYESDETQSDIILFTDEARHFHQNISWMSQIGSNTNIKVFGHDRFFSDSQRKMEDIWKDSDFKFSSFDKYLDAALVQKILSEYEVIRKNLDFKHVTRQFNSSFFYKDINIFKVIFNDIYSKILSRYFDIIYCYNLSKKILSIERPMLSVFMCDIFYWERCIIQASKAQNVKTLMIQHGLKVDNGALGDTTVDMMALFGNYTKNLLEKYGVPSSKMKVTGRPIWDQIPSYMSSAESNKNNIRKSLGLDSNKKIAIYLSEPRPDVSFSMELFKMIYTTFKKFPQFQLINKLHPVEDSRFSQKSSLKYNKKVKILKDVNLFTLLSISDIAIIQSSTTGLESLLFDLPLITVNISSEKEYFPYYEEGVSLNAKNSADLAENLSHFLSDNEKIASLKKNRQKFIDYHSFKQDGLSSKRVSDLVITMLNSN